MATNHERARALRRAQQLASICAVGTSLAQGLIASGERLSPEHSYRTVEALQDLAAGIRADAGGEEAALATLTKIDANLAHLIHAAGYRATYGADGAAIVGQQGDLDGIKTLLHNTSGLAGALAAEFGG